MRRKFFRAKKEIQYLVVLFDFKSLGPLVFPPEGENVDSSYDYRIHKIPHWLGEREGG